LQVSIGICHSSTDSQFIFNNDSEVALDPVQMSSGFMESGFIINSTMDPFSYSNPGAH